MHLGFQEYSKYKGRFLIKHHLQAYSQAVIIIDGNWWHKGQY